MSAVVSDRPLPPLSFVALREQDLDRVVAIEMEVYAFPWTRGNFRDSLYSGYHCWGCWTLGHLIGYAIVLTSLDEAHLLNIAVTRDWQGRGVAGRVLRFLIEDLRKTWCEMIYLEVRPSNAVARHLYAQFGFKQLGLRRNYYPAINGREDALFMGLNIAPKRIP